PVLLIGTDRLSAYDDPVGDVDDPKLGHRLSSCAPVDPLECSIVAPFLAARWRTRRRRSDATGLRRMFDNKGRSRGCSVRVASARLRLCTDLELKTTFEPTRVHCGHINDSDAVSSQVGALIHHKLVLEAADEASLHAGDVGGLHYELVAGSAER